MINGWSKYLNRGLRAAPIPLCPARPSLGSGCANAASEIRQGRGGENTRYIRQNKIESTKEFS